MKHFVFTISHPNISNSKMGPKKKKKAEELQLKSDWQSPWHLDMMTFLKALDEEAHLGFDDDEIEALAFDLTAIKISPNLEPEKTTEDLTLTIPTEVSCVTITEDSASSAGNGHGHLISNVDTDIQTDGNTKNCLENERNDSLLSRDFILLKSTFVAVRLDQRPIMKKIKELIAPKRVYVSKLEGHGANLHITLTSFSPSALQQSENILQEFFDINKKRFS